MWIQSMNTPSRPAIREPLFPLPFTREQIREDVCNILLFEARKSVHLLGALEARPYPAFLNGLEFSAWFDQDNGPSDLEITYDKVAHYQLAMAMEDFFDYGFYAVQFNRVEPMEYETVYTWIGYYLQDCSKSAYLQEWESYGAKINDSIRRCHYVCELANARFLLEDKDAFCYLDGASKEESGLFDALSIRLLAMLAGMEELSLRSAISRKTAPVLEIKKDDRRTFIESEVAKNWLIAKGRYQPVIVGHVSAEIDLKKARYDSIGDFVNMLFDRLAFVGDKVADRDVLKRSMRNALNEQKIEDFRNMQFDDLCNESLMDSIAMLLDLPADLLKIRAKEAALKSRISRCEWELKQLAKA
jgi:hypothetical protein